jgi:hypothetical protein
MPLCTCVSSLLILEKELRKTYLMSSRINPYFFLLLFPVIFSPWWPVRIKDCISRSFYPEVQPVSFVGNILWCKLCVCRTSSHIFVSRTINCRRSQIFYLKCVSRLRMELKVRTLLYDLCKNWKNETHNAILMWICVCIPSFRNIRLKFYVQFSFLPSYHVSNPFRPLLLDYLNNILRRFITFHIVSANAW